MCECSEWCSFISRRRTIIKERSADTCSKDEESTNAGMLLIAPYLHDKRHISFVGRNENRAIRHHDGQDL